MNKKILVLNQGNTENLGDIAINDTVTKYFNNKNYIVDFYPFWDEKLVFGNKYEKYPKIIRWTLWHFEIFLDFFNKKNINKKIKNSCYNAIIIGGGELLSSHYGFNSSLLLWTRVAMRKEIPIYLFGVSGDLEMSKHKLKRYMKALKNCSEVFVRDSYTKEICSNYYNVNCTHIPDVVFGYNEICNKNIEVKSLRNHLLIVPIEYYYKIKENMKLPNTKCYYEYLINLIKKHVTKDKMVIITSSVLSDNEFSKKFYLYAKDELKDFKIEFKEYTNLEDYIKLIKKSYTVISGRMHALILSVINGSKIVPIPFKNKLVVFEKEYASNKDIKKVEKKVINAFNKLEKLIK